MNSNKKTEKKLNTCKKCGYEWEQRFPDRIPKCCPNCKVRSWNK